jgi:hypothetical protein
LETVVQIVLSEFRRLASATLGRLLNVLVDSANLLLLYPSTRALRVKIVRWENSKGLSDSYWVAFAGLVALELFVFLPLTTETRSRLYTNGTLEQIGSAMLRAAISLYATFLLVRFAANRLESAHGSRKIRTKKENQIIAYWIGVSPFWVLPAAALRFLGPPVILEAHQDILIFEQHGSLQVVLQRFLGPESTYSQYGIVYILMGVIIISKLALMIIAARIFKIKMLECAKIFILGSAVFFAAVVVHDGAERVANRLAIQFGF